MLFNSIDFAVFLPVIFILYWFVTSKSLRLQNTLLFLASYVFYGWWDYRFLSLILISTVVDYTIGLKIEKTEKKLKRKTLLFLSILVNIGFLGFFKYYNFFLDNFITAFSLFGKPINPSGLNIILPVGISFYTFQTMSYTIDIYNKKLKPTKDFLVFGTFVSFFPQLVAGPIERASNLLPQFFIKRKFSYSKSINGLHQIAWGFFKKIVIADNCAVLANEIFGNYESYNGISLILGALFFTFQIYCDFSGYSDIAIGTSRLFGFNLMKNFAFPYFSRDIAEFWRRWHISLSTWFRDYLYIPLGGSRGNKTKQIRNIFIIFLVSGFWHGANWTFIVWGFLNALFFLPLLLLKTNRKYTNNVAEGKLLPSIKELILMLKTFTLTVFAWIFFRSENVSHAFSYIVAIFQNTDMPFVGFGNQINLLLILIPLLIIVEWRGREREYAIAPVNIKNSGFAIPVRLAIVSTFIYIFGDFESNLDFIYFQF